MNLKESLEKYASNGEGERFQKRLAEFVAEHKPQVIAETGAGLSSLLVVAELDKGNFGKLYSIDPSAWSPIRLEHERFEQIEKLSEDALVEVFLKAGPFDLCISDGNHDIKAQTYEYEFMFACLKPGGYLVADDTTWANHGAWNRFLVNHGLTDAFFGDARLIQKPPYIPVFEEIEKYNIQCKELAENTEREWLERGNKNSDVQWARV